VERKRNLATGILKIAAYDRVGHTLQSVDMMLDWGRRLIILPLAIQIGGLDLLLCRTADGLIGMIGKKLKAETLKSCTGRSQILPPPLALQETESGK
jgi:hypothetical protein